MMNEYQPAIHIGAPLAAMVELVNFSVFRDEADQVTGFGVSADEIAGPIVEIWIDRGTRALYLQSEDASRTHMLPGHEVTDDVFDVLIASAQNPATQARLSVFAVAPCPVESLGSLPIQP